MIGDCRPSLVPSNRTDDGIQQDDNQEADRCERLGIVLQQGPERELRHVQPCVMTENRFGHAEGDPLPGQGNHLPVSRDVAARHDAEHDAEGHRPAEEGARAEGLAHFEVRNLAGDLHRPDRAIDGEQVPREPRRRDQDAGQVQGEGEQVEVGEETARDGRQRQAPPAIGESYGDPAARKQRKREGGGGDEDPPEAGCHRPYRAGTPCPASQVMTSA